MGLSSPSKAQDSNSAIQLTIADALLSAHCVPASDNSQGLAFQSDSINRTLTIDGLNFLNGATPIVTLRGTGAQGGAVLPVSISIPTTPTSITVNFACGSLSAGTYLLSVSTGNGTPYNANFILSLATRGNAGSNGTNGTNGSDGSNGLKGDKGDTGGQGIQGGKGDKGDIGGIGAQGPQGNQGDKGNDGAQGLQGNPGANGKDGAPGLQGNPGSNGTNGAPGQNGFNGAQGPQGPAGVAKGWSKKFDTSSITLTSSNVLSQVVTGTPAYLVDAKVNSPFANGAKSVACTLTALDNGVTTTIDSSDALLIGNSQTTAKGGISLAGVYSASSSSANVTIGVSCGTGGDTRTLTNGRINIVGANSVN